MGLPIPDRELPKSANFAEVKRLEWHPLISLEKNGG